MTPLEEVRALDAEVKDLERQHAQVEGSLTQLTGEAKRAGYKTLKDLESDLPKQKKLLKELTERRDALAAEYRSEYGRRLGLTPEA